MPTTEHVRPVTVRCGFCLTLNRIDLARAADRPACGECGRPVLLDRPLKVAEEDFDRTVLQAGAPVLVDFYADWCGPCKLVAPLMDELALRYAGQLLAAKVDTDRAPGVSRSYGIRGIPTLILFERGAESGRSVGYEPDKVRALAEEAVK